MLKKFVFVTFLTTIIAFSFSFCFATDDAMSNFGNGVKDTAKEGVNVISSGAGNIGNGIGNVANTVGGAIKTGMGNMGNAVSDMANVDNNNYDTYTATRTSAEINNGMSATMFTWIVISIATIAIIALVWYYGTQNEISGTRNNSE